MRKILFIFLITSFTNHVFSETTASPRFLVYGEGDVMISEFSGLPPSAVKEIDKIKKKKPAMKYKSVDFTRHINEILNAYGLSNYKGLAPGGREIKFKFSSAKLVHTHDKGDCHNYPDTYVSLTSKDFKSKINGKEYVGYPEESFIVFPQDSTKIKDKKIIEKLNERISVLKTKQDQSFDQVDYYSVDGKTFGLMMIPDMGEHYEVYDCTKECKKLDYSLSYPPCGS